MLLGSGIKIQTTKEFGKNWSDGYDAKCKPMGAGIYIPCYNIETENPAKIFVTFASGDQEKFEFTPEFIDELNPTYATYTFKPLDNTKSTLEAVNSSAQLQYQNGTLFDSDGTSFNPETFRLTTKDGVEFIISKADGLESITDINGNRLVFTDTKIEHQEKDENGDFLPTGKEIGFDRDGEGRITSIVAVEDDVATMDIDETIDVHYEYDDAGDLVKFINQSNGEWIYGYDENHNLMSIIDPRGIEILRVEYDEFGRLIATSDALGNRTETVHDEENVREIIKNPNGSWTIYEYDQDGNVTRVLHKDDVDAEEIVQKIFEYDEYGNEVSITNANGEKIEFTYDENSNVLSITNPLGHVRSWTYNGSGKKLTETDANGNTVSSVYGLNGFLKEKLDPYGNILSYSYDQSGNFISKTDKAGNTEFFEYDSNGYGIAHIDILGLRTENSYNSAGDPIEQNKTVQTDNGPITNIVQRE